MQVCSKTFHTPPSTGGSHAGAEAALRTCSFRRVTRLLLWLGSTRANTLRRATALACSVGAMREYSLPVRLHSPEMLAAESSSALICGGSTARHGLELSTACHHVGWGSSMQTGARHVVLG